MLITMLVTFSFLMLSGMQVYMAMLGTTLVFTFLLTPSELIAIPHKMYTGIDSFVLSAIPLFLLVGQLAAGSSLLDRLLALARCIVGRLPGGLAHVNIVLNMIMAGISGSATADAAATGGILIPTMIRERYGPAFSAVVTAAASTIGPVIPPSIPMVALGALVGVSVGRLFLGGVFPGVLVGVLLMIVAFFISRRRGYGRVPVDWSLKAVVRVVIGAIPPLSLPLVIMGGIIGGFFTPTEASGIAVLLILFLGVFVYRDLSLRGIWHAARETIYFLGPVMLIVSVASAFASVLISQRAGEILANWVLTISRTPSVILIMISVVVLVLGCFMESLAIMFLVTPFVMPLVHRVGINDIHFGLVLVQALMIGLITPPFGLSMFIACTIAKIGIDEFARELLPFLAALLAALVISIYYPQVILFLPDLLIPVR